MKTKGNLLNITQDNMSEAQFMSANFVDKEIKNRAFINVLGAETAIEYLSGEGIDTDNLRNMHSIKRVLEKVNIADIILPNIHIDVRVVFDEDKIFVPKSHFAYGIVPNVYMVLKFNDNYENMEFLGYFEPKIIDEEKCNEDYYFVEKSELKSGINFVDFVKNFVGNTEQSLSDSEFFKGRELSVLASDDDISDDEFKQYLQMLKTNSLLRDSVLEYDNFETLSGSVSVYMHNSQNIAAKDGFDSDAEITGDLSEPEELSAANMDISQELDPNGEELINDDSFQNNFDMGSTESPFDTDILNSGISDEAIELAGLAGEAAASGIDAGTGDFDFDMNIQNDNAEVDLFGSMDSDSLPDFTENESSDFDMETDTEKVADDLTDSQISKEEDISVDNTLDETSAENEQQELEDLSLDAGGNLFDEDIDISADDLISMDGGEDEPVQNVGIDLERLDPAAEITSDGTHETIENMSDMSVYESDNTDVDSFEQYSPDEPVKGDIGISTDNNIKAEGVNFDDIEFEANDNAVNTNFGNDVNGDNLYDFDTLSEVTEEQMPDDSEVEPPVSSAATVDDFDDLNEIITEAPEYKPEEVFVNNASSFSPAVDNSVTISDKNFEPGEILLDINKTSLPDFGDDNIGDLYSSQPEENNSGLNNDVRVTKNNFASISPKNGIIGLFLILAIAGTIIFSVMKMMNPAKDDTNTIAGSLNPENTVNKAANDEVNVNPDNVVMNDGVGTVKTVQSPNRQSDIGQNNTPVQTNPSKPIPPMAFLTVKKLSWEVPDYVSYSAEFRQFFQSSGKSLKAGLSSDLLLANDYTYSNVIKLSITFDKSGTFKDARIISSSGSSDVDKIVLQSVNQTLSILKAPPSVANDENTTVILKIYL